VIPGLNVTIQVVDVQKGRVRLGIQAPADVVILREELRTARQTPSPELAREAPPGTQPLIIQESAGSPAKT
jgi:carbon storage regulator CsrA